MGKIGSMNLLVVDDQTVTREVLIAVASSAFRGVKVHAAADLDEALAAARATPMDIVLLDLGLPGCHGIDALKRFRQAFPKVTIVVISSNEDSRVISDALEAGASSFIPKALTPASIVAALSGRAAATA